jgi:hypothetical protein
VVRRAPWALRLAPLVLALSLGACMVTPPDPGRWACTTDDDCLDDFRCGTRPGEQARSCIATCGGEGCADGSVCTAAGTCVAQCRFANGGAATVACPQDQWCGRLRNPRGSEPEGSGLCGSLPTCSTNSDCELPNPPAYVAALGPLECASSTITSLRGLSNLPCLPRQTDNACPAGWVFAGGLGCLPNCDPGLGLTSCPPGMSCYEGALAPVGARESESACAFGFYGAPCRGDDECLVGSCLDTGHGMRCTETCDEAARVSLLPRDRACDSLLDDAGTLGVHLVFTCSGDDASAVCVPRGGVGTGCAPDVAAADPDPLEDDECMPGLLCREGQCTRPCVSHGDCVVDPTGRAPLANGYCDDAGFCRRLLDQSSRCEFDDECVTGLCAQPVELAGYRCQTPRRPGSPCRRDAECLSGACAGGRFGVPVCQ